MHANNITHRDMKPANILIQDIKVKDKTRLIAKLADFETAKKHPGDYLDTFTGTPMYMAPEFLKRPLRYNSSCEIFSVGIIAVQLLT